MMTPYMAFFSQLVFCERRDRRVSIRWIWSWESWKVSRRIFRGCRRYMKSQTRDWKGAYRKRVGVDNIPTGILAEDGIALGVAFEAHRGRGISCVPVGKSIKFHFPWWESSPKEGCSYQTEIASKAFVTCALTALSPLKKLRVISR